MLKRNRETRKEDDKREVEEDPIIEQMAFGIGLEGRLECWWS